MEIDYQTCPIHKIPMTPKEGKYGKFYSHKLDNGEWCNGKIKPSASESTGQQWTSPPPPPQAEKVSPPSPAPAGGAGFSKEEIDRGLKELPAKIARASEEFSKMLEDLDVAKLAFKVAEAMALTEVSKKDLNAQEKQALVTQESQDAAHEVIKKETQVRIKKIKMEEFDNYFASIRKAANLLSTEMSAFGRDD